MAKNKGDNVSEDRKPQQVVGGVTATMFKSTVKSAKAIDHDMASCRGDKAATMEKFKDAGGNKKALKWSIAVESMSEDVGTDFLHCFCEYLKALGVVSDFDFKMAQGQLFEGKKDDAGEDEDDEEGAEPEDDEDDIGKQQADAFTAAHGAN